MNRLNAFLIALIVSLSPTLMISINPAGLSHPSLPSEINYLLPFILSCFCGFAGLYLYGYLTKIPENPMEEMEKLQDQNKLLLNDYKQNLIISENLLRDFNKKLNEKRHDLDRFDASLAVVNSRLDDMSKKISSINFRLNAEKEVRKE